MKRSLLAFLILLPFLAGCGSSPKPSETRNLPDRYQHTEDFLWDQLILELEEKWVVEEKDRDALTLTTGWVESLAPMGRQGQRNRIRVFLEGEDGEGYLVKAQQEAEVNTNDRNPLSSEDAEWKATGSDGALADAFLINFARRLNPRMEWRREMIR